MGWEIASVSGRFASVAGWSFDGRQRRAVAHDPGDR
jgi:hypothetical protein